MWKGSQLDFAYKFYLTRSISTKKQTSRMAATIVNFGYETTAQTRTAAGKEEGKIEIDTIVVPNKEK